MRLVRERVNEDVRRHVRMEVAHALVGEHDAFRLAGGTGRVDEVCQVARSHVEARVVIACAGEQLFDVDGSLVGAHAVGSRYDERCLGIGQDVVHALLGIRGVAWDVGAARFHDAEDGHDDT